MPSGSGAGGGGAMDEDDEKKDEKQAVALDAGDIALLKSYGVGPYAASIKRLEGDIEGELKKISELIGVRESETGLSPQHMWDLVADKQAMTEENVLYVARCTKILNAGQEDAKYMINVRQFAKFVVALGDKVSPTDIDEGMRVGVERQKYKVGVALHRGGRGAHCARARAHSTLPASPPPLAPPPPSRRSCCRCRRRSTRA